MKSEAAIFTIVRNEAIMLPVWLRHYSKMFKQEDIYILDNGSDDGSTDSINANVVSVPTEKWFDHVWLRDKVRETQRALLDRYNMVVFAEADEIIVHVDMVSNQWALRDKMREAMMRGEATLKVNGFDIWHDPDNEPDIDWSLPVMQQRNWMYRHPGFDKPLISSVPLEWEVGFHNAPEPAHKDHNLLLLHLHYADYKTCRDKTAARANKDWNEGDVISRAGFQNRLVGDEFEKHYRAMSHCLQPRFPIPEHLKSIV